jgi:hypothetical protein
MAIVTKGYNDTLEILYHNITTNVYVDNEGNIRGLGKGGVQMIRKEDIKFMVRKISKTSELVFVTILLFLTISFISFFLFIDKNPFWNIQIGFPFPF